jgi:tRNA A37 N6-isopentenylltransferase MiaA
MLVRSVASLMIDVGGGGRYYFHLTNGDAVIRDEEGTEVSSMQSALISAMEMIEELRAEDPFAAEEWLGWRLEIVDVFGRTVHTMPLDTFSLQ